MATSLHNLSSYRYESVPRAEEMRFVVIVSEWNSEITNALCDGAMQALRKHGAKEQNIKTLYVPGSFELVAASRMAIENTDADAIIALGCVIKGDTPHFDYVCQGTTMGIAELNARCDVPVILGVLTTNNLQQAQERAGGALGNKGTECAITAIKMADLACKFKK